MAVVYEVTDTVTGRALALKRLRSLDDPRKQRRSVELFERSFTPWRSWRIRKSSRSMTTPSTNRAVLLSHEIAGQLAITGVAVLTVAAGAPFVVPGRVATELSRRIQQVGDVTAVMVAS